MGFLTDLIERLDRDLHEHPLDDLALMARASAMPPVRDLEAALRAAEPPALIAEVKRASPSAGAIAEQVNPSVLARGYEAGGAAAISVLTEPRHFHGSLADLQAARSSVSIPVLRKDFLIHPSQVIEARASGADAVLLIVAALTDTQLVALLEAASDLGLATLVETHSDEDLRRALETDAAVIGVNARDLETLEVDVPGALTRVGRVPKDRIAVVESGITTRADVDAALDAGASAILVGRSVDARGRPGPRGEEAPLEGTPHVTTTTTLPDARGRFGSYGGRYVPEVLIPALEELAEAWYRLRDDPGFRSELDALSRDFVGRPTPITPAARLSGELGYRISLKREDLAHTGAHKINNALGQALLAKRLGKERIIAETGAGMHGVATATACALLGMPCVVYMGEEDTRRQAPNVSRMELLGAEVVPVTAGSKTLKEAVNEALRDWAASVRTTHYIIGSVVGPHPFPVLVRDLQRVIGDEARPRFREANRGAEPDVVAACVGGGSNAIGMFTAFVGVPGVRLIGVEAGGRGTSLGEHCASLTQGEPGILHGALSYLLQDEDGQVADTHSISAGLDYPGVGPEHAYLRDAGLAEYVSASDEDALAGFQALAQTEGIIPALEPAHVIGWLLRRPLPEGSSVLVCLSGRGDKDLDTVRARLGIT